MEGAVNLDDSPAPRLGFLARRRLQRAIGLLQDVLAINPANWAAMLMSGKAHESLGRLEDALGCFRRAQEFAPTDAAVAKEAGSAAGRCGRHDLAVELMLPAAAEHPGDPALQSNLGLSYLMSGRAAEACEHFGMAVALEPDHGMNARLLAVAEAVRDGELACPRTESELSQVV